MEIIIGKNAGFCFGVKNAVNKVEEELEKNNKVYCLGELVHNKQVTDELVKKGAEFIDDIKSAKESVVIRAHGTTKQVYEKARNMKLNLIDLTCPKVLHIHNIAENYSNKGYFIIATGKREHPEMIGTISFCGENYYVIEKEEDVDEAIQKYKNSNRENALLISQTTYSLEKFNKILEQIKHKIPEGKLEIKNTICSATKERQDEVQEIAKIVDVMIIVGGKHSSNSNKLYELAKKYCKKVLFVETEKEVDLSEMKIVKTLGIMAGASTPQKSIEQIVEKVKKVC